MPRLTRVPRGYSGERRLPGGRDARRTAARPEVDVHKARARVEAEAEKAKFASRQ